MFKTVGLFEGWWNSLSETEKETILKRTNELMDKGYSVWDILDNSIASSQYLQ